MMTCPSRLCSKTYVVLKRGAQGMCCCVGQPGSDEMQSYGIYITVRYLRYLRNYTTIYVSLCIDVNIRDKV